MPRKVFAFILVLLLNLVSIQGVTLSASADSLSQKDLMVPNRGTYAGSFGWNPCVSIGGKLSCQPSITNSTSVSLSAYQGCASLTTGQVKCWGSWTLDSDFVPRNYSTPFLVPNLSDAVSVAMAGSELGFACALRASGQIACWGFDDELNAVFGAPWSQGRAIGSALTVEGIENATSMAVGDSNVCASLTNGTVKCFGSAESYNLGEGYTASGPTLEPVTISGVSGVSRLGASSWDSGTVCAIQISTKVLCWGNGQSGQLGNGRLQSSKKPVQLAGLINIQSIEWVWGNLACARDIRGAVKCWGMDHAQSDPPTILKTPKLMSEFSGSLSIYGDGTNLCALMKSGQELCRGPLFGSQVLQTANHDFVYLSATPDNKISAAWGPSICSGLQVSLGWSVEGSSQWESTILLSSTNRIGQTRTLNPAEVYSVTLFDSSGNADNSCFDSIYVMPQNGKTKWGLTTAEISWSAIGINALGYRLEISRSNTGEWQTVENPEVSGHHASLSGLDSATFYQIRITPFTSNGDLNPLLFSGSTLGTGRVKFHVTDSSGNPVSLGDYSWISVDRLTKSSAAKAATALGEVTFSSIPAKRIKLHVEKALLASGELISGDFSIQASAGDISVILPETPAKVTSIVRVSLPNSVRVPGAKILTSDFSKSAAVSGSGFDGFVTSLEAVSGITDAGGEFKISGYPLDNPEVYANFDDGELDQTSLSQPIADGNIDLAFEYMPFVEIDTTSVESTLNQVVEIPVQINDPASTANVRASNFQVRSNSLRGITVSVIPPKYASQNSCRIKPVLSIRTNASGSGLLKVCASASGIFKFKTVGAVSPAPLAIFVNGSKPMAVTNLITRALGDNSVTVSWSEPAFIGSSDIGKYLITAKSGNLSRTINLVPANDEFSSRNLIINDLQSNLKWVISVSAVTALGTSPSNSSTVLVSGPKLFSTVGAPKISGAASVGKVLTGNLGKWDKSAEITFEWLRDGVQIDGATSLKYRVSDIDLGAEITLRVRATADGYRSEVAISNQRTING